MPLLARSRRAVAALTRPARWSRPAARRFVIAVIMLGLAACSGGLAPQSTPAPTRRPQPTPTPRSAPPTLAEAEYIVRGAAAATELRWEQSFGGLYTSFYTSFELTLAGTGFRGELKGTNDGNLLPVQPLESPPEALEEFLLAVAAAPLHEGDTDDGTQGLDYYPRVWFEFTTATDTVHFACLALPADCATWNVWIMQGRHTNDEFPFRSRSMHTGHFLSTDVSLIASLEVLLRELGVDTFRDPTFALMKPQR